MYIKKLNWGAKVELSEKKVEYFNQLGALVGPNTIEVLLNKK